MEVLDDVQHQRSLPAQQAGVALNILVNRLVVYHRTVSLQEDVVVDPAGEQRYPCRDHLADEVHPKVELPGALRFQVVVAEFVAQRALVLAIAAQLADIGGAEAASRIDTDIQVGQYFVGEAHAARDAGEESRKVGEARHAILLQRVGVQCADVETHPAAEMQFPEETLGGGGKRADVEQMVRRNQELRALVSRHLAHSVEAEVAHPTTPVGGDVANIVTGGVQQEVKAAFLRLFKLLTAVLLIAEEQLQIAFAEIEHIVGHHLIVINLLKRRLRFFSSLPRPIAFNDAGLQVIIGEFEATLAPSFLETHHPFEGLLAELGVEDVAVDLVGIFASVLLAPAGIPDDALFIAGKVKRVVPEVGVGLVTAQQIDCHLIRRGNGCVVHNDDTGHRVGAVHQGGGAFDDLHGVHALAIDLHAVLVAPLLAFLADTVVDHQHAVVAHSANHGLGDAPARGDLRDARIFGDGIDDIAKGKCLQSLRRDDIHRDGAVAELRVARKTRDHNFREVNTGVRMIVLLVIVVRLRLRRHRHREAEQKNQNRCFSHCLYLFIMKIVNNERFLQMRTMSVFSPSIKNGGDNGNCPKKPMDFNKI